MSALLETHRLSKSFGAVVAAADINVKVETGEVVGIIGANGAGKTSFVNMITGYLTPTSGDILFEGRDITGLPSRKVTRAGISRSFQIPQLFLNLTVLDNMVIALAIADGAIVGLAPTATPARVERASQILERFGVDRYARQDVSTLAQGVRKVLDIAMATVGDPRVIFLDEPTSGVSVEEKMTIMEGLFAALSERNISILFIEHDMEIVEAFAPRVMAFYEGRVLADAPMGEVLEDEQVRKYVIGNQVARRGGSA
jgi:branched-chain amino acid transport system ATP-binding protein